LTMPHTHKASFFSWKRKSVCSISLFTLYVDSASFKPELCDSVYCKHSNSLFIFASNLVYFHFLFFSINELHKIVYFIMTFSYMYVMYCDSYI
jgi:hypothetical protein